MRVYVILLLKRILRLDKYNTCNFEFVKILSIRKLGDKSKMNLKKYYYSLIAIYYYCFEV